MVTPTGGFRDVLSRFDVGILCDGFTSQEISAGLKAALDKSEQGTQWQFEEYKAYYSWERNAEITKKVYRQLLERKKSVVN